MKNEKWLNSAFKKDSKISWPCPNCYNQSLKLLKDVIIEEESADSQGARDSPDWGPEFIQNRFAAALKCSTCKEAIAVVGHSHLEPEMIFESGDTRPVETWFTWYFPTFFEPPLHIFELKDLYPENIREALLKSFKLFWCDSASCANRIRTTLELLMDQQGINKSFLTRRGKRKRYTLHERIELYKVKNKEVAGFLLAIKWIGNSGSHVGDVTREDILDAYNLLEHSLNTLYDNRQVKLKKISKEINSRKGTRKRN